ncbi:MAG: hypothetical protein ACK5Y8_19665 [Betaproteobacteria bacterium]|jgi:polyhydroxyalkanoate synthesis regulator phasin|nr:hypothetical protein [Rubrivivax sp.]
MATAREVDLATNAESGSSEPLYLHLSITDPEVAAALTDAGEGRDRQEFAQTALRIGVLSLKAARGTIDGGTIRHEGERLLLTLEERLSSHREVLDEALGGMLRSYFDPSSGSFSERVQRLVRQDGELSSLIAAQVDSARRTFDMLFSQHLGEDSELRRLLSPEEGNELLEAMRGQVDTALQLQSKAIVGEFTLDRPDSALSRLVRELKERHGDLERSLGDKMSSVVSEFSLDNKDSALSRLVGRVDTVQRQIGEQFSLDNPESGLTRIVQRIERFEQAQTERTSQFETRVTALLEKLVTRREESRRSTAHGHEFEARAGEQLQAHCLNGDDILDAVGDTTGQIPRCKVGDFGVTLGPDSAAPGAAIVVEAKASGVYTLKSTLEEADQARRNRTACVCLFVHSARTVPAGLADLHRWGQDVVVVWDEDEPATDVRLKAAYMVAKALAVRAGQHDEAEEVSLAEMDVSIEAIRKQLAGFEEIQTSATTVVKGGEKIYKRAAVMSEEIERRLLVLQEHTSRMRTAG